MGENLKPPRVSDKTIKRAIEKAERKERKSPTNRIHFGTQRIVEVLLTQILDSSFSSSIENDSFYDEFYVLVNDIESQPCIYKFHVKYVFKNLNEEYEKKVIVKSKLQRFEVIWSPIKKAVQMLFEKSLEIVIDRMISKMFHKNNSIFQRNCFSSFFSV